MQMTASSVEQLVRVMSHTKCCDTLPKLRDALEALRAAGCATPRLRLRCALKLRRYARTLGAEQEYAWACYHAAVASAALGRAALAERLWAITLGLFGQLKDPYGQARVAMARGRDAADHLEVSMACVHFEAALALASTHEFTALQAKVLLNLSNLAEHLGDIEGALRHLEDLIQITQGTDHVVALVNATRLAQYLKETRKAQRLIVQALLALDGLEAPARQLSVRALTEYSRVLLDGGDIQGSLTAALKAYENAEVAADSVYSRAEARLLLASACLALGESARARAALGEVETLLPELPASALLVRLRVRLGQAYAACGLEAAARAQLNAARGETAILQALPGVAGAFGSQVLLAEVLCAFVEMEEGAQNFVDALALHREFHALDRSNITRARAAYAQALSEQYEMEQEAHLTKALQLVNKQLLVAATEDPLTKALNRRAFEQEAERLSEPYLTEPYVGKNRRVMSSDKVALVLLDLDHFKQINDRFGHPAGDAVLIQVVRICNDVLRECDRIARWGGEEFILLLRGTDLGGGLLACERVRQRLHTYDWDALHPGMNVTASFGVGAWLPHELLGEQAFKDAVADVDAALYRAKRDGRDRCEVVMPKERGALN